MSTTDTLEPRTKQDVHLDVLQKEKARKDGILQMKYQKEFLLEQNKLKEAEIKRTKLIVEEQEVSARSFKAWYEKMYYSLECEIIEPKYKEYQERTKARMEKEKAEYDEIQKKLQEEFDKGNKERGEKIELEAVPELTISELQNAD